MGNLGGNEISCAYYKNKETISLLYDYSQVESWSDEIKMMHNEAKNNLKFIDIYINGQKIEFNTKYTSDKKGQIQVKFIFHKLLTNISYMFCRCYSLISIDLSSFNVINVTNMKGIFYECYNLKSIDLSTCNKNQIINMSDIFSKCYSLKSIDLSSFNTTNVTNMRYIL